MQARDQQFDSKLIIYRARQVGIAGFTLLAFIFFAVTIGGGMEQDLPWGAIAVPVSLVGLLFILYPQTEDWEYKAWQSLPQKVEQQSSGK